MDGVVIGEPGFLIGERRTKLRAMMLSNNFKARNFLFTGQRYRKVEEQKSWHSLARNQDFAEEGRLEVNFEK